VIPLSVAPDLPAGTDLREALDGWLRHLGAERRLAPNTLELYRRAAVGLVRFLAGHLGGPPSLADLRALDAGDLRGFLAERRKSGAGPRTLALALSALRSFARFLVRSGQGDIPALGLVGSPRAGRALPRPVPPAEAVALVRQDHRAGEAREPWVLARDAAVLALLYGCGLRISEALALRRAEAPLERDAMTVTGKGGKTRMVPVIPAVREALADYLRAIPTPLPPGGPLFIGEKGGPLSPRIVQRVVERARGALGLRAIQELLGHASLSTTQVYTAVDQARLLAAYAAAHPRAR
jgi:integrase/recombinase XerC